jgi:oligoribonuclease
VLHKDNLIWIDLEMTGLRTDEDTIIEIATVVTDSRLQVLAEGPVLAIHTPDAVLSGMDEWNTRQHGASGLVARIRASDVTLGQAEAQTLAFLKAWVPGGVSPMCGNSICQDRRFLARQMPQLERYFHYRNLDVSTLKELARRLPRNSRRRQHTWRWPTSMIRFASCSSIASGCSRKVSGQPKQHDPCRPL